MRGVIPILYFKHSYQLFFLSISLSFALYLFIYLPIYISLSMESHVYIYKCVYVNGSFHIRSLTIRSGQYIRSHDRNLCLMYFSFRLEQVNNLSPFLLRFGRYRSFIYSIYNFYSRLHLVWRDRGISRDIN